MKCMFERTYEGLLSEVGKRYGVTEETLVSWEQEARQEAHNTALRAVEEAQAALDAAQAHLHTVTQG